jgi:hypothetical protein
MRSLYTSYYGNWRKYTPFVDQTPSLVVHSISRQTPPGIFCHKRLDLAPASELLTAWKAGKLTEDAYTVHYLAMLDLIGAEAIAKSLPDCSLLLCYEKSGSFCHRHILADYLKGYFDVNEEI